MLLCLTSLCKDFGPVLSRFPRSASALSGVGLLAVRKEESSPLVQTVKKKMER